MKYKVYGFAHGGWVGDSWRDLLQTFDTREDAERYIAGIKEWVYDDYEIQEVQ